MRYPLRSLVAALALGPPILAAGALGYGQASPLVLAAAGCSLMILLLALTPNKTRYVRMKTTRRREDASASGETFQEPSMYPEFTDKRNTSSPTTSAGTT